MNKMFKNKLIALEHPNPNLYDEVDLALNKNKFAEVMLWLEDHKIRHYTIDDRQGLRNIKNLQEWDKCYKKYLVDLNVPAFKSRLEELAYLLNYAVRLEFMDDAEKYDAPVPSSDIGSKQTAPTMEFNNMDMTTSEFEDGVRRLAELLKIPHHPDHLLTLSAVAKVVSSKLTPEALKAKPLTGQPFPITEGNIFKLDDPNMNQACAILTLLQIQGLRKLQTAINETVVSVQEVTADPKTDTKLGKVGF